MQYRRPSSLAPTDRSSIRRRSGGGSGSPQPSACRTSSQDYGRLSCTVLDNTLDAHGNLYDDQPTVILVPSSGSSPFPSFVNDDYFSHKVPDPAPTRTITSQPQLGTEHLPDPERDSELAVPFTHIPLTPRPPLTPSHLSSDAACNTPVSLMHRLPSPDFTAAPTLLQSVARGLGYYFTSQSEHHSNPAEHSSSVPHPTNIQRPQSFRSEHEGSVWSALSRGTSSSVEHAGAHLGPAPSSSLNSTNRFTHKWPKPHSLRTLERRNDGRRGGSRLGQVAAELEEGRGLGIDRVERWSISKWCLVLSLSTVFWYGMIGLACAILTWFRTWNQADVMYVADGDILILITLSSSILIFTALVGTTGALLNSRPIIAVYALLLWPAFISILAIGYMAYKRATFALDRKLNFAWSQYYTPLGRLLIQDSLKCCGFYDALHEATPSKQCYTRTPLPGCKGKLFRFESANLATMWSAAFALVPLHILNMFVALLTANHVTSTFGKGITPRRYRLSGMDVRTNAERLFGSANAGGGGGGYGEVKLVRPVLRPEMSKASSSRSTFREDREERLLLEKQDLWQ